MEVLVSVLCTAYNHEKYITRALDGFVMQKTDFTYEVLIHDDASTDSTVDIIKQYQDKYPKLIKTIFQEENQYSQGKDIYRDFLVPRVKGKYIAICEGDDYWTDPYKLQKQVDVLEKNIDLDICTHKASIKKDGEEVRCVPEIEKEMIISTEDVIKMGGGGFATASIMYRKELEDNFPLFRKKMNFDYSVQIHGALRGGMYYIPQNMAVYNLGATGSWTERMRDDDKYILWLQKVVEMMELFDEETGNKYSDAIRYTLTGTKWQILYAQNNYQELFRSPYREKLKSYPIIKRWKIILKVRFPFIRKVLAFIKRNI